MRHREHEAYHGKWVVQLYRYSFSCPWYTTDHQSVLASNHSILKTSYHIDAYRYALVIISVDGVRSSIFKVYTNNLTWNKSFSFVMLFTDNMHCWRLSKQTFSNLATRMSCPSRPRMIWLISTHSNFCIPGTIQRSLVDVGRSQDYILVINYHSFRMNINHKSVELLSHSLENI